MNDCIHLKTGTQRTYVVWRSWRMCLDCCHDLYERDRIPSLAGVWLHVKGARKDKEEERSIIPRHDSLAELPSHEGDMPRLRRADTEPPDRLPDAASGAEGGSGLQGNVVALHRLLRAGRPRA